MEKQDIERMKKDLPKYNAVGVLPLEKKEQWEVLLSSFCVKYGSIPQGPVWILDELQPLSVRSISTSPVVIPERITNLARTSQDYRKVQLRILII